MCLKHEATAITAAAFEISYKIRNEQVKREGFLNKL